MKIQFYILIICLGSAVLGAPADSKEPDPEPSEKPEEPTEKPEEPTEKPAEPTENPAEPTEKPAEPTEKPAEPPSKNGVTTKKPIISLDLDTAHKLQKWGEAAKNAIKKPTEIVKDSVNIVKDSVKLGTDLGEAAVSKGVAHIGKESFVAVTDLGKMGINMGTTIANNTLGVINKIGDMMPVGGGLVKGGVNLGRKGLTAAKALGENFLDNLLWWAESGFGWLSNSASDSRSFLHNKTENIISTIHQGIDTGANKIGDIVSAGINKLPVFKVNASLTLG